MKVVRNGQQVEFHLNEWNDLIQTSTFRAQAGFEMPKQRFLLPLGEDSQIVVEASNLGLARQMVRMHIAEQERIAAEAAAKKVEEDAAWASRGRLAAREQVAQQVANLDDETLNAMRETFHADRRNLVNLYIGEDRTERIAETDLIIGVIEEEQAERAGLMSSANILAAFSGAEDLSLESEAANALPRPANESYEIGQRVICVNLPHIGATVRSLDDMGVGLDYDTDDDEERGTHEALYSAIRPMPIH